MSRYPGTVVDQQMAVQSGLLDDRQAVALSKYCGAGVGLILFRLYLMLSLISIPLFFAYYLYRTEPILNVPSRNPEDVPESVGAGEAETIEIPRYMVEMAVANRLMALEVLRSPSGSCVHLTPACRSIHHVPYKSLHRYKFCQHCMAEAIAEAERHH